MVETALEHIRILESLEYDQMKVSIKATDVPLMIEAYRKLSSKIPYPLHLGVTEAGTIKQGTIKSSIGIGTLLADGIGGRSSKDYLKFFGASYVWSNYDFLPYMWQMPS